jgi:hypothetical protein
MAAMTMLDTRLMVVCTCYCSLQGMEEVFSLVVHMIKMMKKLMKFMKQSTREWMIDENKEGKKYTKKMY